MALSRETAHSTARACTCVCVCVCLSIYKLPTRRAGAPPCNIYASHTYTYTQTHNSRIQGSPKNSLTNVKPIILADAGRSVALGKRGTDTRATMMRSRRKGRGRRTQQRRSRGAEAAEKGERLFCPAVKTCKSSPTTRRTKKKKEAGGKGTASGEQRRRWRARRSGEKRERYSEAFCERAAPCHAAPCQATPCSVPSHAAVRSTAVAELSRRGAPRRNCQGRGALLACACAWRGDTLTGVSSTAVAHSLRGDGANSQRAVARHYAGAATRDEAH